MLVDNIGDAYILYLVGLDVAIRSRTDLGGKGELRVN